MKNKLKYVFGDILSDNGTDDFVLICHQVNCMGKMGAGLALQVRNKYPEVYSKYTAHCGVVEQRSDLLGEVLFVDVGEKTAVANIFGQYGYGKGEQHTDYDALREALRTIVMAYPRAKIRIPYKMGCGLGGGDWNKVTKIICEEMLFSDVEIWRKPTGALVRYNDNTGGLTSDD